MDGQRQKSGWGRGRRRRSQRAEPRAVKEPVLIVARRPDSPRLVKAPKRAVAASAVPKKAREERSVAPEPEVPPAPAKAEVPRRTARIVQMGGSSVDERERERQKLLSRLMTSQGRGAITRAADEFLQAGFEIPREQAVHLQLLEHFDESRARDSLGELGSLLREEAPIKRPVLDQRLRRLEEHADEAATRELAASLRRSLRS